MATKSLKDLDHLQSSIKSIVEDALKQVDVLQKSLHSSQQNCDNLSRRNKELTDCINTVKASDSEGLFVKYVQIVQDFEEYKRRVLLSCCAQCQNLIDSSNSVVDEDIRRELEEISSLELDSQFEADSPCIVQETPSPSVIFHAKTPVKSNVARNLMRSIFGATPEKNDTLACDTPVKVHPMASQTQCNYIPETMPQSQQQETPKKIYVNTLKCFPCTNPGDKLTSGKKPRMGGSEISPSWQSLFSPSPKKRKSPKGLNRTPSKRLLKNSHRIQAENTAQGTKMFSQTQLKFESFKKAQVEENLDPGGLVKHEAKVAGTPLNSVENNVDLNETSLTASAVRKLADNNVARKDVKKEEVFISSYDRIPDDDRVETRKACRKNLPGLECQDCKKWYNHFDNGDECERRKLLDQFSRHRTKHIPISDTPEGYWKPMLSPSPKK